MNCLKARTIGIQAAHLTGGDGDPHGYPGAMPARFAAALCLLLACPALVAAQDFHVDAYAGTDDRDTLNRAFAAMRGIAGAKRLILARRTYRVSDPGGEGFTPVLAIAGIRDLDLDGNGAVIEAADMLGARQGYLIGISDFAHVRLRNLHVTYRPLPYVQGRITAVDQPGNRVEVELDPAFARIDALRAHATAELWCRVGQRDAPHLPKADSPSWLGVASRDGGVQRVARDGGRWSLRAGGFDLVKTIGGRHAWAVGDPLVVWQRGAQDALAAWAGRGLRLEDIVIDSALHFAIKVRGVEHAEIARCRIEPVPGGMLSGCADGIDVQQSRDVTVRDCRVIANGDDAVSFLNHGHGRNGLAHEQRFAAPLPDTNEDVHLLGNRLEGGNRNGILLLATRSEVRGNAIAHIRQYGLKCTGDDAVIAGNAFTAVGSFTPWRHIADELDTGIVVSDVWTQRRWTVQDNTFTDWFRMPGILLKSVEDATITGNRFIIAARTTGELHPINPYLQRNAAICLTGSVFQERPRSCSGIVLHGNLVRGAGIDPLAVHGQQAWSGEMPQLAP